MAEKIFEAQSNYGWGLSLNMTGKAPAVAKRIFDTYADALDYVNNFNDSAIEGLILTVVADTNEKLNGGYFVKKVGTEVTELVDGKETGTGVAKNDGEIIKLGADSVGAITSNTYSDAVTLATNENIGQLIFVTTTTSVGNITYFNGPYVVSGNQSLLRLISENEFNTHIKDTKEYASGYTDSVINSLDANFSGDDNEFVKIELVQENGKITEFTVNEDKIKHLQTFTTSHTSDNKIHITSDERAAWNKAKSDIDLFLTGDISDNVVDTLKEIQDYITNDGAAADEMVKNIASAQTRADEAYELAEGVQTEMNNLESIIGTGFTSASTVEDRITNVVNNFETVISDISGTPSGNSTFVTVKLTQENGKVTNVEVNDTISSHTNNADIHVTDDDKANWNAAEENAKKYASGYTESAITVLNLADTYEAKGEAGKVQTNLETYSASTKTVLDNLANDKLSTGVTINGVTFKEGKLALYAYNIPISGTNSISVSASLNSLNERLETVNSKIKITGVTAGSGIYIQDSTSPRISVELNDSSSNALRFEEGKLMVELPLTSVTYDDENLIVDKTLSLDNFVTVESFETNERVITSALTELKDTKLDASAYTKTVVAENDAVIFEENNVISSNLSFGLDEVNKKIFLSGNTEIGSIELSKIKPEVGSGLTLSEDNEISVDFEKVLGTGVKINDVPLSDNGYVLKTSDIKLTSDIAKSSEDVIYYNTGHTIQYVLRDISERIDDINTEIDIVTSGGTINTIVAGDGIGIAGSTTMPEVYVKTDNENILVNDSGEVTTKYNLNDLLTRIQYLESLLTGLTTGTTFMTADNIKNYAVTNIITPNNNNDIGVSKNDETGEFTITLNSITNIAYDDAIDIPNEE